MSHVFQIKSPIGVVSKTILDSYKARASRYTVSYTDTLYLIQIHCIWYSDGHQLEPGPHSGLHSMNLQDEGFINDDDESSCSLSKLVKQLVWKFSAWMENLKYRNCAWSVIQTFFFFFSKEIVNVIIIDCQHISITYVAPSRFYALNH